MVVNEKKEYGVKHSVRMEGRSNFSADGILDVINFDENIIGLDTKQGKLVIKGTNLKIEKLNLENSEIELKGQINSLVYDSNYKRKNKSLLQAILK